jgi:hypothetical protein
MGRRAHFLTPYIVVLHAVKKANKSNKYAVCRACISVIGNDEELEISAANTVSQIYLILLEIKALNGNFKIFLLAV